MHFYAGPVTPTATESILDWLTAIGTLAAVLAAVVAIFISQVALREERRYQRLRERYREAVDLLTAFEAVRAAIPKPWGSEGDGPTSQDRRVAAARYLALLRASEESLPINRACSSTFLTARTTPLRLSTSGGHVWRVTLRARTAMSGRSGARSST